MRDMRWHATIIVHSNAAAAAAAAIGIDCRKGLGKVKHLYVTDLLIQDKTRIKTIQDVEVFGTEGMLTL